MYELENKQAVTIVMARLIETEIKAIKALDSARENLARAYHYRKMLQNLPNVIYEKEFRAWLADSSTLPENVIAMRKQLESVAQEIWTLREKG